MRSIYQPTANNMWQQWLNLVAGVWIVISSFMGFTLEQMVANMTVSGIVVAGLALWGAVQHNAMMRDGRIQRHA